jgi:hypothetical protein
MTNPAEQPASMSLREKIEAVLRNHDVFCDTSLSAVARAVEAAIVSEPTAMSATEACATIPAVAEYVAQLEAERDALRKDAERLDYLQQQGATVSLIPSASKEAPDWYFRIGGRYCSDHADIRAAIDIDAALSKKGPQA